MPLCDHASADADAACTGTVSATYQDWNQLYDQIEEFLQKHLPACVRKLLAHPPGNSVTTAGERALCADLCSWINSFAEASKTLFRFKSEAPDSYNAARTPDFTTGPAVGPDEVMRVGVENYHCTAKLYVIEAKRLPSPLGTGGKDREREYVVSDWDKNLLKNKPCTGGVERFKEAEHGGDYVRAGMIAFIQAGEVGEWLRKVNGWIQELVHRAIKRHSAAWAQQDLLRPVMIYAAGSPLSEYESQHARAPDLPPIRLRHFWLVLT